jgi:hypothetical protein
VAAGDGLKLFEDDLKEGAAGKGAEGEHAFGLIEAEPRSQTTGDEDHADLAGAKDFGALSAGLVESEVCAAAIEAEGGGRRGACRESRPLGLFITSGGLVLAMLGLEIAKQVEVDLFDLIGEARALVVVETIPEGQ